MPEVQAPAQIDVRCYSCSQWIAEHPRQLRIMAVVRKARERDFVEPPRVSIRCKGCGWTNIFEEIKLD